MSLNLMDMSASYQQAMFGQTLDLESSRLWGISDPSLKFVAQTDLDIQFLSIQILCSNGI